MPARSRLKAAQSAAARSAVARSAAAPLGIIAGGGELPLLLMRRLQAQKRDMFVLGIRKVTDPAIARYPHAWCPLTALGRSLRLLQKAGCRDLVLIGAVARPRLEWHRLDWLGLKVMTRLMFAPRLGDNRLLRAIVRAYEEGGLRVRPVEDFVPELAAAAGYLGRVRADKRAKADWQYGLDVVRQLGALDISQAAVVCRGQVLAVEGVEGTDFLLQRIADLPPSLRGTPRARAGVLVKLPKPRQERRVDLPTLGPQTVRGARRAGLAGIVFAAGGTLLLRKKECAALADKAGMFLFGAPDKRV